MSDYQADRLTTLETDNRNLKAQVSELEEKLRNATLFVAASGYGGFRDINQSDALHYALHQLTGQPRMMCEVLFNVKPKSMK